MIIYIAGSSWDGVPGTDLNLATALAEDASVLFVEPPVSITALARSRSAPQPHIQQISERLTRLTLIAPPGVTRPIIRSFTAAVLNTAIKRCVKRLHEDVTAVIVASPAATFPRGLGGVHLYYVTDDWLAGSTMMGLDAQRIRKLQLRNIRDADVVAAVSPALVTNVHECRPTSPARLLPNGCRPSLFAQETPRPHSVPANPYAVFSGVINERIDLDLMRAILEEKIDLVVVGPRLESDKLIGAQLDDLFESPYLHWVGRQTQADAAAFISHAAVGITPYAMNRFNLNSFPLKTLDYLAAGIPVVSTNLPASKWLETDLIEIANTHQEFVDFVIAACKNSPEPADRASARRALATQHSWSARAREMRSYAGML